MGNLNKLVMQTPIGNASVNVNPALPAVFVNKIDTVANDLGRPIKIVGIFANLSLRTVNLVASQLICMDIAIGTQNNWNPVTNIFNWKMMTGTSSGGVQEARDPSINQMLGNMKDELFTLKQFSSEVSGGNAEKGELFLNARFYNEATGIGSSAIYKAYIALYYK